MLLLSVIMFSVSSLFVNNLSESANAARLDRLSLDFKPTNSPKLYGSGAYLKFSGSRVLHTCGFSKELCSLRPVSKSQCQRFRCCWDASSKKCYKATMNILKLQTGCQEGLANPPKCEPITCTSLTKPASVSSVQCMYGVSNHPHSDDEHPYGTVCTFYCPTGLGILGQQSLTCSGDSSSTVGSWTDVEPTCQAISCPATLTTPTNGAGPICSSNQDVGSICTFSCLSGHVLVGSQEIACTGDGSSNVGQWSSQQPTCEPITCPTLSTPANGNVPTCSDSNNIGSVCTFTCTDGFGIVGSSTLTCGGDGNYDNEDPTCQDKCQRSTPARRRRKRNIPGLNYVGFVVDDTGSMANEIAGLRQWLLDCVAASGSTSAPTFCGNMPSGGWLLQTFNDPTIGTPFGPTTNAVDVDTEIGLLTANGGGDCPELAFSGLQSAIDQIPGNNGNCKLFFFTDATAADPSLAGNVLIDMIAKGCTFIPILTGCCGVCTPINNMRRRRRSYYAEEEFDVVSEEDGFATGPVRNMTTSRGTQEEIFPVHRSTDPLEFLYYELAHETGGEVHFLTKPSTPEAYTTALAETITTLGYCPTDIMVTNEDGTCFTKEQCVSDGHCFDESVKVCFENSSDD